jgi:hypothetical protein
MEDLGFNIIIDDMWKKLGLPTLISAPYTLWMGNQTFTKQEGLIKYFKYMYMASHT